MKQAYAKILPSTTKASQLSALSLDHTVTTPIHCLNSNSVSQSTLNVFNKIKEGFDSIVLGNLEGNSFVCLFVFFKFCLVF